MQKNYASSNLKLKKRVATQCKRLEKSKHFYTLLNLADECQMVTGRNSLRAVLDNQPKKQKVIKMYLTSAKKKRIVRIMESYAQWSAVLEAYDSSTTYALKMQAELILELVDLGIPHYLEKWARELLDKPYYAFAVYTEN